MVVWNCNAKSFLQDKKLQNIVDSKQMPNTEVYLLSGKKIILYTAFEK
jgi:uncharacterized protein YlzI (FlbEa/FlbD family)